MGIELTRYVRPECFVQDLVEKSRDDALRRIVHTVAEKGLIKDENDLFVKLVERENIQSTGVGNGIAVPHCLSDEIPDLMIIVARSLSGVEFNSFDGKPTQVIILLICSSQEHGLHVKALMQIARLIKRKGFIEKIISSTSVQDMVRAFDEEESTLIVSRQGAQS